MEIGIQWPLVLFTVISGAGYGLMAACGVARLAAEPSRETKRVVLVAAFCLLVVGGLMSVFHLAHPERFMGAIANLFTFSGIALELIGLAFGALATVVFFAFVSTENAAGEKVLAVCSIVVGVVAAFLQGYAYVGVAAQAGWHFIALAFCYLFTSLSAGAATYLLIGAVRKDEGAGLRLVGRVTLVLAVLAVVSCIAYAACLAGAGLVDGAALGFAVAAVVLEACVIAAAALCSRADAKPQIAVGGVVAGVAGSLVLRVLMWAVAAYEFSFIWDAVANRGLYLF